MNQPTLETPRLLLRPFALSDALRVQRLAGDYEVAKYLLQVPHPYADGLAEQWISTHPADFDSGKGAHFAIVIRQDEAVCGAISLDLDHEHQRAGMGYWLGREFWAYGYATEAAQAVIRFGFDQLKLNRIVAEHFTINPASGRVMQKVGMKHEGSFRQHFRKWGQFVDSEIYGVLAEDWRRSSS